MARVAQLLLVLTIAVYPLVVYSLIDTTETVWLGLGVVGFLLLRMLLARRRLDTTLLLALVLGISYLLFLNWSNSELVLKLYPAAISVGLLLGFSWSLMNPPTIIERLARATAGDLPPEAIIYTRNVTIIWCCFFVFNITISIYTALAGSMQQWAFYNGFLSYLLIGFLFSIEYLFRRSFKRRLEQRQLSTCGKQLSE